MENNECCICGKEASNTLIAYRFGKQIKVNLCNVHLLDPHIESNINTMAIFEHFGEKNQIEKFKEEMAELIEAIERKGKASILEEMADCALLFEQFRAIYNIHHNDIQQMIKIKQNRTMDRIKTGYYEGEE